MEWSGERIRGLAALAASVVVVGLTPGTALGATILPSTATDESANNATCSLREAVQAANTNSNAHEDACAAGESAVLDQIFLGRDTYVLTGASGEESNVTGDLDVGIGGSPGPLEITGRDIGDSIIDADIDRAIQLLGGSNLTLAALTIENSGAPSGNHPGGAILASGTGSLTLNDVRLNGNSSPEEGGAVATGTSLTALTINDSTIDENVGGNGGGGIYSQAPLALTGGRVIENRAEAAEGGGLLLTKAATVSGAQISGNSTAADDPGTDDGDFGGGIEFEPAMSTETLVLRSEVAGNFAEVRGGGVHIANGVLSMGGSTIQNNDVENDTEAADETGGGGIALDNTSTTNAITSSTIAENESSTTQSGLDSHGGILNNGGGTLTVRRSTVNNNSANGELDAVQHGGGISNNSGTLNLINSTISGNITSVFTGVGGGLDNDGTATIISTTFGDNGASDGHAINDQGNTTLGNSIIEDTNTSDTCTGSPTTTGNNVAVGTTCVDGVSDATDLEETNALLGALADNGGPTQTQMIPPASPGPSPALNHVPAAECLGEAAAALTVDQRDAARPITTDCDSGAVERQTTAPAAPTITDSDPDSPANENDPEIKGSAAPGTLVALFTDSSCSTLAGEGNYATFASPGITVGVGGGSTTTFFANATNEAGTSPCSALPGFTYIEASQPNRPTFTGSTPSSPANDNNPEIMGNAETDSTVVLYTTSDCTGAIAGLGTTAAFLSPGITVTVPDNSTTTFFADTTNANGTSLCSLAPGLSYTEVTSSVSPPINPPLVITPPTATENPECAALRKKLKKAKTKKKKKKIRRKLRRLGC